MDILGLGIPDMLGSAKTPAPLDLSSTNIFGSPMVQPQQQIAAGIVDPFFGSGITSQSTQPATFDSSSLIGGTEPVSKSYTPPSEVLVSSFILLYTN